MEFGETLSVPALGMVVFFAEEGHGIRLQQRERPTVHQTLHQLGRVGGRATVIQRKTVRRALTISLASATVSYLNKPA